MKFLIINGPNLNLLGKREPGIYGENSYESLCRRLKEFAAAHASTAECFQSNHEGAILDAIHAADGVYDAIVLNPGAYTHYSYAILDARSMRSSVSTKARPSFSAASRPTVDLPQPIMPMRMRLFTAHTPGSSPGYGTRRPAAPARGARRPSPGRRDRR